jgi:hypothetical protein
MKIGNRKFGRKEEQFIEIALVKQGDQKKKSE